MQVGVSESRDERNGNRCLKACLDGKRLSTGAQMGELSPIRVCCTGAACSEQLEGKADDTHARKHQS